ncbi:MAG: InlB B-repeat-containing protein, partial [Clostridia bacterium]|nr:InlB B-repeat-containing protein [Clostridia bacterium]
MKTKTNSLPRKLLSVLLVCMMTLSCMTLAFTPLKASADANDPSTWATDGYYWETVNQSNSGKVSRTSSDLLVIYTDNGQTYAVAYTGDRWTSFPVNIVSGAAYYSTEDVDGNNQSSNIKNIYYFQSTSSSVYYSWGNSEDYNLVLQSNNNTVLCSAQSTDNNGLSTYYYNGHRCTIYVRTGYAVVYQGNGGVTSDGKTNLVYKVEDSYHTVISNPFTKNGHTFTGWLGNNGVAYTAGQSIYIDGPTVIVAQWEKNSFKVYYDVNGGSAVTSPVSVEEGSSTVLPATSREGYTFTGWYNGDTYVGKDGNSFTPTSNVTLTAHWQINTYTVTWLNEDGTQLEKDENVPYGTMPEYNGSTPAKAATDQYSYTFAGWSPALANVTGDATYTATFTPVTRTYTVTWKNYDGSTLETDLNVPYGTTPSYDSATPAKAGNAQYTYTFAGWTPAVDTVTGDVTYTATFNETVNEYTVTWVNYDGTELEKDVNVPYGTMPEYNGSTPVREKNAQYTYTFDSWSPEVSTVTGDVTYTATFTPTTRTYTVTWLDWDDAELEKDENVPYGTIPSFDGETPSRENTAQYTYQFVGWTPDTTSQGIEGNITFKAVYTSVTNAYNVTWVNEDGTELEKDVNVPYGTMPEYNGSTPEKAATAQYTYEFDKWDPAVETVKGDIVYTATYTSTVNEYTVTYVDEVGTVLKTVDVKYGDEYSEDMRPAETDPSQNYSYVNEPADGATITGDVTVIVKTETKTFTITYVD